MPEVCRDVVLVAAAAPEERFEGFDQEEEDEAAEEREDESNDRRCRCGDMETPKRRVFELFVVVVVLFAEGFSEGVEALLVAVVSASGEQGKEEK